MNSPPLPEQDNWGEDQLSVEDDPLADPEPAEVASLERRRRQPRARARKPEPRPFARLERMGELRSRGWCTGPLEGLPPIGSVGIDLKAACCKCGKRVRVTVRGKFSHHKPKETSK